MWPLYCNNMFLRKKWGANFSWQGKEKWAVISGYGRNSNNLIWIYLQMFVWLSKSSQPNWHGIIVISRCVKRCPNWHLKHSCRCFDETLLHMVSTLKSIFAFTLPKNRNYFSLITLMWTCGHAELGSGKGN